MDEWELAARYIEDANGDGDIEDTGAGIVEYYPGNHASGADADYDKGARADYDGDGDQDTTGNVAWYGDNSGSKTRDVATKDDNALGLFDMSGNVAEWNFDWHPDVDTERVVRGGSWYDAGGTLVRLQLGRLSRGQPDAGSGTWGFRPARNAE